MGIRFNEVTLRNRLFSSWVRLENPILGAVVLAWIAAFTWDFVLSPSTVQREQYGYLPFMLQHAETWRDVGGKLFDVCQLDGCLARFRPLGHLLEWGDSFLTISISRNLNIHFKSFVQFACSLLTALALAVAFRPILKNVNRTWRWALAAFVLSLPSLLVLNSFYFRPEKIFSAAALAGSLALWQHCRSGGRPHRMICAGVLAFAACGDEVIPLYLALFTAVSWIETTWITRETRWRKPAAFTQIGLLALAIFGALLVFVGPWAFRTFATGPINRDYSSPLSFIDLRPRLWAESVKSLFNQLRSNFGGGLHPGLGSISAVGVIFGGLGSLRSWRRPTKTPNPQPPALTLVLLLGGVTAIQDLLVMRHRWLLQPSLQFQGYYYVTPVILLFFFGTWAASRHGQMERPSYRAFTILCLLFVSLWNFHSMPEIREFALEQNQQSEYRESRIMETALRNHVTDPAQLTGLSEEARNFYRIYARAVFAQ